jgi:hypothetical protein
MLLSGTTTHPPHTFLTAFSEQPSERPCTGHPAGPGLRGPLLCLAMLSS